MKYLILMALFASTANAGIKDYTGSFTKDNPEYKQIWLSGGKEVNAPKAFQDAASGKEVYKCQNVEVAFNKNGTGVSIKNKKRKVSL